MSAPCCDRTTQDSDRIKQHRRQATTLVEVLIAGMLLGTVMVFAVPALRWIVMERRASERRQQAALEVENVMERFTVRPWDEITAEKAAQLELSPAVKQQLPGAVLNCAVKEKPDAPGERRVYVELTWENRPGQPVSPMRLTTWVHEQGRR